jgi:hypothetical protein
VDPWPASAPSPLVFDDWWHPVIAVIARQAASGSHTFRENARACGENARAAEYRPTVATVDPGMHPAVDNSDRAGLKLWAIDYTCSPGG